MKASGAPLEGLAAAGLDRLMALLPGYGDAGVFNQYGEVEPRLDRPEGAAVRCQNLRSYLVRFSAAHFVLVGEAAGYAGCRFSGIPFTSEVQVVGPDRLGWTRGLGLARSSIRETPWEERSAATVWRAIGQREDCLLWNAFPWHPFRPSGPLSNRPPGRELEAGLEPLACLLSLFPGAQPVAVGRVAQRALEALGKRAPYVRHPSRGGQRLFAAGLYKILAGE